MYVSLVRPLAVTGDVREPAAGIEKSRFRLCATHEA